jgi:hypothetical protein
VRRNETTQTVFDNSSGDIWQILLKLANLQATDSVVRLLLEGVWTALDIVSMALCGCARAHCRFQPNVALTTSLIVCMSQALKLVSVLLSEISELSLH